ncbi:MAG: hypothetical protein ACI85I_002413 [Arenicella sp.]|jgi:hypothetical protein
MLNHAFGRYGLSIDGAWIANTEYSDSKTKALLIKETKELVETYKNTPGLLLFLLGNENNYGLFWEGAETESVPIEDRKSTARARSMYKTFNEAVVAMKAIDTSHPIAICNGDLLFLDIIKEECKDIDILGTNMYRGVSFGDAFKKVRDELNLPIMFTEFGADSYNAMESKEDQEAQAFYMTGNWKEIYDNAAGLGLANNSLGGYTFQFSDGWWKFGQTKNLDIHDNNASWPNGGYSKDFEEGENNMNEEWFGVCAKGQTNANGMYQLYPRAAYYSLAEAHKLNPYAEGTTLESIGEYFKTIKLSDAVIKARSDKSALQGEQGGKLRISELRAEFSTFITGGKLTTTPDDSDPNNPVFPNEKGFDNMESFYVGIEARPAENVRANVVFNVVGNVAQNPIDAIFYENRARPVAVTTSTGSVDAVLDRVQVYRAEYTWDSKHFELKGFYRTGHYHWAYEGDFFGLYPEANYGPNIDIYNGLSPRGMEITGKKAFDGFKVAYGPELWWGANPAILVKYQRSVGKFKLAGVFHEDIDQLGAGVSSLAVPQPKTRRLTLHAERDFGKIKIEAGGIWGGQPLVGRTFQFATGEEGNYKVFDDKIKDSDTWGGKVKFTYEGGKINWYMQAAAMGLVANGGADATQTFTGWRLKDTGSGNQTNFLTGFTYNVGKIQIAPNFLWQKPLVDPMPMNAGGAGALRNILNDPFVVRANRETVGGEILLTFDPTPGTWMYAWDSDRSEDAPFAASLGFVYRHLPTSQDAAILFTGDGGRSQTPSPGAPPALDLWEVHGRIVNKLSPNFGIITNLYGGNGQANGPDTRTIERFGGDVRLIYKSIKIASHVKVNDWGPFDFHRDFNLTFPLQLMADISTTIGKQDWFVLPNTTLGMRFTWRSLDQNSSRYLPSAITEDFATSPVGSPVGFPLGNEWEFRTYLHINLGQ